MINFLHKPCCADGDKAGEISRKIKEKYNQMNENELEPLISIRLGTKKIPSIKLSELIDFPRISDEGRNIFRQLLYSTIKKLPFRYNKK